MIELRALVAEELARTVDPRVGGMAAAIAAKHGQASRAVLFYGSCLRQQQLEGLMLDFYLIVSDYRAAYAKRWLAVANRLIPPNVFHVEHEGLVAKYAVLSEADFAHECSILAWTVSTAARFAQPSRLVWSADRAAAAQAIDTVAMAAPTLFSWTRPAMPARERRDSLAVFRAAFAFTFAAELRAERLTRSGSLVDADPERYRRFGQRIIAEQDAARSKMRGSDPAQPPGSAQRWWRAKQRKGKLYSIPRLAKASLTFAGGADYIAWKINRHAGTTIELKPWQQRHPLLAAVTLLPKLLKSGAVR